MLFYIMHLVTIELNSLSLAVNHSKLQQLRCS